MARGAVTKFLKNGLDLYFSPSVHLSKADMMEHQVATSSELAIDQDMHTGLMKDNMGFDLAKTGMPSMASSGPEPGQQALPSFPSRMR